MLLAVALAALGVREAHNARVPRAGPGDPSQGWFSNDPDGLYHARRVERAIVEGLPPAERDPWLAFPDGAAIPWPPYYDLLLAAALAPFAPGSSPSEAAERAEMVERAVSTLPCAFAVATSILCALAGWWVARPGHGAAGAVVGGLTYALLGASIYYSAPGTGDHHAWATLLATGVFALAMRALAGEGEGELERERRAAAFHGAAAGVVAGLLLGSWVGGLVQVGIVQAALGWLLLRSAGAPSPRLAPLGLALHLTAAAVLLPAVLSSPWRSEHPWMVVNLSWFHLAWLLAGAGVFAPLCFLRPSSRAVRLWPWTVAAALGAAGLAIAMGDFALARSVREGFDWASRANTFMATIQESRPLLAGGILVLGRDLGWGALLALPAWAWVAWRAFAKRDDVLLVWAVAFPVLAAQALAQRRFGDVFGPTMAVVLAAGAGEMLRRIGPRARLAWTLPACAALVVALSWPTVADAAKRVRIGERWIRGEQSMAWIGNRELCQWLARSTPEQGEGAAEWCVLAPWDRGHFIEWAGRRPTVATNFGSYVGVDSFLDPARFLLDEDPQRAEELLEHRRARYVLVPANLSDSLDSMLRLVRPGSAHLYLELREGRPAHAQRWWRTMGARLMNEGNVAPSSGLPAEDSLPFLRLVHVSPKPYPLRLGIPHLAREAGLLPCGWIWERVPGARVEASGASGEVLELRLEIVYPVVKRTVVWSARATVGADGVARLRVPYSTGANGDGRALGPATWTLGSRAGTLPIPEAAIAGGLVLSVP